MSGEHVQLGWSAPDSRVLHQHDPAALSNIPQPLRVGQPLADALAVDIGIVCTVTPATRSAFGTTWRPRLRSTKNSGGEAGGNAEHVLDLAERRTLVGVTEMPALSAAIASTRESAIQAMQADARHAIARGLVAVTLQAASDHPAAMQAAYPVGGPNA
jgi:hypothetical protein